MLAMPDASAQNMVGRVLASDELVDGVEVVFEARSGTASKGHYLVPFTYLSEADGTNPNCVTIPSILEVPDKIVWVLERAQVDNVVTGLPQYYIKNKETGKYLSFEWNCSNPEDYENKFGPDAWVNKWVKNDDPFVADTASAKAFCLVSNSDEQWRGQYGSNSYGSSQSDWEPTTYTIVYIFDATGKTNNQADGAGYGRMYLCNEFPVSGCNITWYSQFQDTNVWDIRRVSDRSADPKEAMEDLLTGFSAGGDDYISKPFSIHEVLARVGAVLRRQKMPSAGSDATISIGGIEIIPDRKLVRSNGADVMLTPKEYGILQMLMSHPGRVYSRDEILRSVWQDDALVLERTVDVHITRIRSKLGGAGAQIVNRQGYGYCFTEK